MIEQKWYERMTPQEFDDYEEDMSRLDLEDQFEGYFFSGFAIGQL